MAARCQVAGCCCHSGRPYLPESYRLAPPSPCAVASRGLLLQLQLGEEVPTVVSGDEFRLRQVLLNLLFNAVT